MHTVMDLELLNYINMDMKWNIMKKGRTGITRRPRKLGEDIFDLDNKVQEPSTFETKKFGMEKLVDAPLKKRRLLYQSPSPPPQTPCLNGEVGVSPGPQTPAVNHEDFFQRCRSSSLSQGKKTKSKTRLRKSNIVKQTKNKVFTLDDFSGIELLAAAACGSFVSNNADPVEDLSVLKERPTPQGISLCTSSIKEAIVSPELIGSSIQGDVISIGKEGVEKDAALSKELRLHWDLNTVMYEWEEPCDDLPVEPHSQENLSKSVNLSLKGYERRCAETVVVEEKSMLDSVYANQLSVKHDAAIIVKPLVENCNGGSFVKKYELIEDFTCSQKVMCTKMLTSKISDGECSVGKSGMVDLLTCPEKCDGFSTSTTSVLREQTIVKTDQQPVSAEVMQDGCQSPRLCKSSCDNRVNSEDPLSECCGSNVTQDEQGHMAEEDSKEKLEAGYDSPFEDGELRELIENPLSEKETNESDNIYKDDVETIENTLLEKVDHGQTMEDPLLVKEAVLNNDIQQYPLVDTFKRPDESTSFDMCRNGEYVQRIRSSNIGDYYSRSGKESGVDRSMGRDIFHSRNYKPRGGGYRSQNSRHSPSERNNGYRGPPVRRSHSRDRYHDFNPSYFERKPHFPPKLNRTRSRSRSRSGSPIAWNFQKRKNLDNTCNSGEIEPVTRIHMSPERSSKYTDGQIRDKRQSPVRMIQRNQRSDRIRYPERLKSDDQFWFTQRSARFSQMTGPGRDHIYKDNNDAISKHDGLYEKVNRFKYVGDNDSFENLNRRNLDGFSRDSPKEHTMVTPPRSRS